MEQQYLGYKTHVSLNAQTGLITSLVPTAGSAADNRQFPKLLAHDEAVEVKADIYAGDKAYDDTDLHYRLWEKGKHSALRLKQTRTRKKDANKEVWLELEKTSEYEAGLRERYKIERKFGEAKRWQGFGRCRYVGLRCYGIQAFLTAPRSEPETDGPTTHGSVFSVIQSQTHERGGEPAGALACPAIS